MRVYGKGTLQISSAKTVRPLVIWIWVFPERVVRFASNFSDALRQTWEVMDNSVSGLNTGAKEKGRACVIALLVCSSSVCSSWCVALISPLCGGTNHVTVGLSRMESRAPHGCIHSYRLTIFNRAVPAASPVPAQRQRKNVSALHSLCECGDKPRRGTYLGRHAVTSERGGKIGVINTRFRTLSPSTRDDIYIITIMSSSNAITYPYSSSWWPHEGTLVARRGEERRVPSHIEMALYLRPGDMQHTVLPRRSTSKLYAAVAPQSTPMIAVPRTEYCLLHLLDAITAEYAQREGAM